MPSILLTWSTSQAFQVGVPHATVVQICLLILMVPSCAVLGNKLGQGGGGNKLYLQNTCVKWHIYLELGALPSGKELCGIKSAISLCDCQPASACEFPKSKTPAKWLAYGV